MPYDSRAQLAGEIISDVRSVDFVRTILEAGNCSAAVELVGSRLIIHRWACRCLHLPMQMEHLTPEAFALRSLPRHRYKRISSLPDKEL